MARKRVSKLDICLRVSLLQESLCRKKILEYIQVEIHSRRSMSSSNNPDENRPRTAKLSSDIQKILGGLSRD